MLSAKFILILSMCSVSTSNVQTKDVFFNHVNVACFLQFPHGISKSNYHGHKRPPLDVNISHHL
jgi:hypothetical protein